MRLRRFLFGRFSGPESHQTVVRKLGEHERQLQEHEKRLRRIEHLRRERDLYDARGGGVT